MEYQAGVDGLREEGFNEAEAHAMVAWAAGERWARRPGDRNYYGYLDCRACDQDGPCGMCAFADAYNSTPRELLIPPVNWVNEEEEDRWGTREWEAQVLEAYGLLDTAADPEEWPGVEVRHPGAAEMPHGAGNGDANGRNEGQEMLSEDDNSEDDASTVVDLQEQWGAPEPADPNWV